MIAEELRMVSVVSSDEPLPKGWVVEHAIVVSSRAQELGDQLEALVVFLPLHVVFGQTGIGTLKMKMGISNLVSLTLHRI